MPLRRPMRAVRDDVTAVPPARRGGRRLRWAVVLAPTALVLAIAGPSIAQVAALPVSVKLAQPAFAALGALTGCAAVYQADSSQDELGTIADENLRLLLLMVALLAIAVCGAWLWLGLMDLVSWLVQR